jgi:xanthine dehydrogenase accessory factor
MQALADGRPRLVAIEGSCASEGLVEVFIEPQLPEPLLAIAGVSPAGETLADLAARIGWRVVREVDPTADAVVVASLGTDDEGALKTALATPAGYVGLVASQRRGASTLAALREEGLDEETLARIRCPAGLDLGPSTQEEIAVAILAELVAWRHTRTELVGPDEIRPLHVLDPVCGMEVSIATATETAEVGGVLYYFCGAGCRRRFEADPASYLTEVNRT